ncbi:transcription termination/antitermination factor NusG [Candidatus Aerophobetes bacterium]|uniref:Transcription termination/antitermination protein NusG n=1 Tax=Aerophobetes bacterium TaxID=2030807 RepID=A0A662DJP9_UNCAE|nr:transcription termination/antitermination factor NusG [Candidatus Aerophobetes bacterium]RLE14747.1 MAG: transcription termination/antitermination protein NusG [Candidatus Aerophobetes bacterium]HDN84761.1 transcription termination/antitermination factor NusG [Candidatus Aerophobetes bacterium]
MGKRWYAIHTYAGQEDRVKANLEQRIESFGIKDKISRILIPKEKIAEVRNGKRKIYKRKFFPGYILIEAELDDQTRYVISNTPGVTGFVGPRSKPIPLDKKEVDNIEYRMGLLEKKPKPGIVFEIGETVRITQGPFANFQGEIIEINPQQQRLKVLVSIFGRETPVELEYVNVEKL